MTPKYIHNVFRRFMSTIRKKIMSDPWTIAVEGNIGSGKTTFLNHIEKLGNVTIFFEPLEKWRNCQGHNLLELMYNNPVRYSFTFQSYVQLTLLQAHNQPVSTRFKLLERSIYSARFCFVEKLRRDGFLAKPEFSVVDEWFKWINLERGVHIDLFVYLRTNPDVVYERILKRNRTEERALPFDYIKSLHEIHEKWLYHKTLFECPAPVFTIDANMDLKQIGGEYEKFEDQVLNKKLLMSV